MEKVVEDIKAWFAGGSDFDQGITLLRQVNRNQYYIRNIERARRQSTLVYELGKALRRAGGKVQSSEFRVQSSKKAEVQSSEFRVQSSEKKEEGKQFKNKAGAVVLREQFPFLGEAGCPDELKILVADMITAHTKYMEGHSRLFSVAHKGYAECFAAGELTVENYIENRKIWNELEHYKKTKTLLREHPIFDKRKKEEALLLMPVSELKKRVKNLKRQLSYRNSMDENTGDVYAREREISDIKRELAIVQTLIEKREKNGK